MRVLIGLTYYRPHYSGLTIYAERLARALTLLGHDVTVLTSQFSPTLPLLDKVDGVTIVRVPPLMRVSKGIVMPAMPGIAWKLIQQSDVVNLHVPQMDAFYIAWMAALQKKPVIITYQCDLQLPSGPINFIANKMSDIANHIAARPSAAIVNTTLDYAEHSPFLQHYLEKLHIVNPPVELVPITDADISAFRNKFGVKENEKVIGMASRLATEKGVEHLVEAMPGILKKLPNARVLFVGPYENVVGEDKYAQRIIPLVKQLGTHWSFLGILSPTEMSAFFHICDVLTLPSLNSTEAFGMVQVESMICGTPVVTSNLPGVRQPVLVTGMGKIFPIGNTTALETSILDVLENIGNYRSDIEKIKSAYSPENTAIEYVKLFEHLLGKGKAAAV
jgi:glycosyltransferase involved in cell wall biosynthesis